MCVFKYHAFIYFLRPPPWYGTIRTEMGRDMNINIDIDMVIDMYTNMGTGTRNKLMNISKPRHSFKDSDIGYGYKFQSDIQHNTGLHPLQSDIQCSDIRLSPISFITGIGLSAHLCKYVTIYCFTWYADLSTCR